MSAALHGYHRYTDPSVAMEPTLRVNQTFNARPVRHGRYVPKRGDVVVFTMPSWSADGRGTQPFVKRVVAIMRRPDRLLLGRPGHAERRAVVRAVPRAGHC